MRELRAWVLLTALSAACSARAAEDAGSQSIFAYGAGARALGMGGAACAIRDGHDHLLGGLAVQPSLCAR